MRTVFKHDLLGQKFGRWTAIEETHQRQNGHVLWLCKCDCGTERLVEASKLVGGHSKSCGCLCREEILKKSITHNGTHTRLYSIWHSMRNRCENPNHKNFSYYGGRGIIVCDQWKKNFTSFRDWALSNGYNDDLTLDRINPDGNYCPENCRWVTWHEQRMNQRRMKP